MKKIVIINDIHSMYYLLEKILEDLKDQNIDDYIICGDSITDGFDNNKVIEKIRSLTTNVIIGNREQFVLEYDGKSLDNSDQYRSLVYTYNQINDNNKKYLETLPEYKVIEIENKKICYSHGSPYNIREIVCANNYDLFDKLIEDFNCDVYLFAHTHIPFKTFYKNKLFINSGAISCSLHGRAGATYGILTIDKKIDYIQKEYSYDFNEIKNYYINSEYYNECHEWCNLLLHSFRTGLDCCGDFIKYLDKTNITCEIWNSQFNKFMKEKNFEIY